MNRKTDKNHLSQVRQQNGRFASTAGMLGKPCVSRKPTKPTAKQLVNHVAFVLDTSTSMYSAIGAAVDGFNSYVEQLKAESKKTGQKTTVSLFNFPNRPRLVYGESSCVNEIYCKRGVETVKKLDGLQLYGSTPLLDSVGQVIERLQMESDSNDANVSFLVVVMTDGEDNQSVRYNKDRFNALLRTTQATDRWTISFLLPVGYKSRFCQIFNIPPGNCQEWENTVKGTERATASLKQATQSYYAARSTGSTSTQSFYTDLSGLSINTIQTTLQNIQDKVKLYRVEKECEIAPFCTDKTGKQYETGMAFYQLTKTEKVAPAKQILVKEKTKPAVYGGYDARKILGLPEGQNIRVKPGNHANYDIFIQSNSDNRKLVRGTQVVYMK